MTSRIPVTIVGGYLGAGKTTLVNHLLRHANGLRLAVLVNDFGDLPIDADLIEAQGDGVVSIAGGCVCCSFGSDLMAGLAKLRALEPAPAHVLLEASGIALPGAVADAARLAPGYALDAVVVLADAETIRRRASDSYMGDTVERQLAQADLIVVNKLDLAGEGALAGLMPWLRERATAQVVGAFHGQVPLEVMLGAGLPYGRIGSTGVLRAAAIRPLDGAIVRYDSASYSSAGRVDVRALAKELTRPELGLVRAKGVLRDASGELRVLQLVGARCEVSGAPDSASSALGCVCIGLKGVFDRPAVDRIFERARA